MKPEAFGRALERARLRAERQTAALHSSYQRIIETAASHASRQLVSQAALTASDWQPPPEGTLVIGLGVTVTLREQQAQAVETVTRVPLEQAGIAWNPEDPLLQAFLQQTEAWAGLSIEQAFQPELRKIITEAFQQGLAVKDAAALIRSRFAETAVWQAEMLARSNLNMIGNGGMQIAVTRYNEKASAAGDRLVETKTWVTAGDAAVRPSHVAAAGQTVPVDQSFQVGSSMLSFPGDPGGALAEVLNCRCVALYGATGRRSLTAAVASPAMTGVRQKAKRKAAGRKAPTPFFAPDRPSYAVNPVRDMIAAATIPAVQWVSDLAFEGEATSDGRYMMPRSIEWRDLPLTLMAQTVTDEGHDGAFVSGRIDRVARASADIDGAALPDGVVSIRGGGIFDMGGDNGAEIARLVGDETLRGVSVDLAVIDWAFRDPDTGEIIEPTDATEAEMERAFFGELQFAVRKAELLAATVCPTPAFANAKIALAASGQQVIRITSTFEVVGEALVAAAPVAPPREWFFTPEANGPAALTVTDDGHVYGHAALWNACHTGFPGRCFQPPPSPSGYSYFNNGEIVCTDGERVGVGQLTMRALHASLTPGTTAKQVKAHYENTGVCAADVRAVDGIHGVWISGAVRSTLTDEDVRELRGAKVSGDWRQVSPGGPLEMIGALEVNTPGFPVPRPQLALAASASHPEGEPVALIAAGVFDGRREHHLAAIGARLEGRDALAEMIG